MASSPRSRARISSRTNHIDSPLTASSSAASPQASSPEHHTDTHSLSASITEYPMHWGRRYHKFREGAYLYPNDEAEMERLNDQHDILNKFFHDRLVWSPIEDHESVTQVLDLGTGTGDWPIELADSQQFPNAEITGVDLSGIQPRDVPPNVFFEIQDCSDTEWYRDRDSFDLIRARFLAGSLEKYDRLITTSKRYLKPEEGWLELHEVDPRPHCDDGTMDDDFPFKKWEEDVYHGARKFSRDTRVAHRLADWLRERGFEDVQELLYKIPLSEWPKHEPLKEVGKRYGQNWVNGLPGFSYKMLGPDGLGLSRDEIELKMMDVRNTLHNKGDVHAYLNYYVCFGRKSGRTRGRDPS